MIGFAKGRRRRHRGLFWSAVVLATGLLVGGTIYAYAGYAATAGPDGAVKGFFAALQRGDAPAALAFGDVPAGPRTLLTRTVLREQTRIAPIQNVRITSVDRNGDTARVGVQYDLAFPGFNQLVSDSTTVRKQSGSWLLSASAVSVRVGLAQAIDRATLAGTAVSADPVLIFPGAIPVRFDTAYLQLDPNTRNVRLNSASQIDLGVGITTPGQDAVTAALMRALPACLRDVPAPAPSCPRPTTRAIPDSLHGTIVGTVQPSVTVAGGATGMIDVVARVTVKGTYRTLDFNNIAVVKTGTVTLPVHASAYATSPIQLAWADDAS
jgi:hypothetical protein